MKRSSALIALFGLICGSQSSLTFAVSDDPAHLCLFKLLDLRKQALIEAAINTGYQSVDQTSFVYDLGGVRTKVMLEANTVERSHADQSTQKGRGTLWLIARVKSPMEAMNLYARVIDGYLQEVPVIRYATTQSARPRSTKRTDQVTVNGGAAHRQIIEIERGQVQPSRWKGEEFETLSSDTDIEGILRPASEVFLLNEESNQWRLPVLGLEEGEYFFIIMPHRSRAESERGERIFRSIMKDPNVQIPVR